MATKISAYEKHANGVRSHGAVTQMAEPGPLQFSLQLTLQPSIQRGHASLLTLPVHIRKGILGYLLTEELELSTAGKVHDQKSFLPLGVQRFTYGDGISANALFTHNLLGVSRQIRQEALSVIISTNQFKTEGALRLKRFLEYIGPILQQELRRLRFELIPRLWAVDPEDKVVDAAVTESLELLSTCRNLSHINVGIHPIWALQFETTTESLWTIEDLMRQPVFSGLAKLRCSEQAEVEWIDYETDWFEVEHGFTYFRDRVCDHSEEEAHMLLIGFANWLENSIRQPWVDRSITSLSHKQAQIMPRGSFPLLALPRELRDEVYSFILAYPAPLRLIAADRNQREDEQHTFFPLRSRCRAQNLLQHPILRVSRQVRAETEELLYSGNTFKLPSLFRLSIFMHWLGPDKLCHLTSLSLYIHTWEDEFDKPAQVSTIDRLVDCKKLLRLSLVLDIFLLYTKDWGRGVKYEIVKSIDEVYDNDVIQALGRLRGLKTLEIKWIPFFSDPGFSHADNLSNYMTETSSWLRKRMLQERDPT